MFDFNGQVVLVTGAGSARGIGRVIAHTFARQGATVVICDINKAGVDANVKEMQEMGFTDVYGAEVNLSKQESVDALVADVVARYGRIDVLVNNAGLSRKTTVPEMDMDEVRMIMEVNVFGLMMITKAVCKIMQEQNYGRIVNLSSVAGKRGGGIFGGAHYSASKGAVLAFSKNLARDVVQYGITSNCVCPGLTNTDIWRSLPQDQVEKILETIPMGRAGEPQEVANAVVFLASKEASYITGEEIDVNGGAHMD